MASAPAVKSRRLRSSGMREALENPSSTEHLRDTAGGDDLLARLLAEGVQAHRERVAERPVGETLHRPRAAHQAPPAQLLGTDRAAGREGRELAEVHDRVADPAERAEAALGHAALERHLAALVARRRVAARARPASLVTTPGGLALPRARTPSDPFARSRGARRRLEVPQVD